MMIYANMDFYKNKYQGAVINTANPYVYFRKATNYIRHYTCDNIDEGDIPEQVKMCCCEVAELLYYAEQNSSNYVTSDKTGDMSVTYESTESQRQVLSKKIKSAIYMWLSGTGLLYRGVK